MPEMSVEVLRWAYARCASKSYDPMTDGGPGEWERDNRLLAELKAALDEAEAEKERSQG